MITAWRLVRPPHDSKVDAFSGEGARLFGGRWNSAGVPVVYVSDSLALAALETLAHADAKRFERDYTAYKVSVPEDKVLELGHDALPGDWRARPVSAGARRIGDVWGAEQASAALAVPSVIVPLERNLLLNPRHPAFGDVEIGDPIRFRFDARLEPKGE